MNPLQTIIAALGRICLSAIFILAGVEKILNWQENEQNLIAMIHQFSSQFSSQIWVQELLQSMLPWSSELLVLAILLELVGGGLVFFGFRARFGAFLLLLFLIPTTLIFHHFWLLEGSERELQMVIFLKNLSIFGGLLLVVGRGKPTTPA